MLSETTTVHNWLKTKYQINAPSDWLEACIEWVKAEFESEIVSFESLCGLVFTQWLSSDLQDIGFSCLPSNILSAEKLQLNDIYCLQCNSIADVSSSLYSQQQKLEGKVNENINVSAATQFTQNWNKEIKSARMLMLKLTDGNVTISGIEFKPIPTLSVNLSPGTKIMVHRGLTSRHGVLMLTAKNITILGGEVDQLVADNNSLSLLQSCMNNNINNMERYRKQLPCKTFDSSSKFNLNTQNNAKNNDFNDDMDDSLLVCLDQIDTKSMEVPSLKRQRMESSSIPNIKCKEDSFLLNAKDVTIKLENAAHPINENNIAQSTSLSISNNKNHKYDIPFNYSEFDTDYLGEGGNNEHEFIMQSSSNLSKYKINENVCKSSKAHDTTMKMEISSNIVDEIDEIINSNLGNNIFRDKLNSNMLVANPKNEVLSTQDGNDFYKKCLNFFKEEDNRNANEFPTNSEFNCSFDDNDDILMCENAMSENYLSVKKEINLDKPFTYLSRITAKNLMGTYSVKSHVEAIIGVLSHNAGQFWSLAVRINDGTMAIKVQLSDLVIEKITGLSAIKCAEIKKMNSNDATIKESLIKNVAKLRDYLIHLSAILDILFSVDSEPVVVNIREITEEDIVQLQNRISSYK